MKKIILGLLSILVSLCLIAPIHANDNQNNLNIEFNLRAGAYFDGDPFWGVKQKLNVNKSIEVPYEGWHLMRLDINIPYQDGLVIKSIEPTIPSLYPEYSNVESDDNKSSWTYSFYFYENGTYTFTINYSLNGNDYSLNESYTIDGLVSIKDIAMRRHLINQYGEYTDESLSLNDQYVTLDSLATTLYDPWNNISFDFGKDGDNGSTAENTTSLDGLQYLENIHGMYLYKCKNLVNGETIEPITKSYYPNLSILRISDLNVKPEMPKHAYNAELVTQSIANMPALEELVINGTGFSDVTVFKEIKDGNLSYLQAMLNNIVSLDGIESQKNLSSINIGQNQIKSIEPLRDLNQIDFLNLTRNQVFDISPINDNLNPDAIAGNTVRGFAAKEQSITYDKTVIAKLDGDKYVIELPMPIDIDGTLTDTANVSVKFNDSVTKSYSTSKENGKTYISIPASDIPSNDSDNPFDGALFTFSFNNTNGTDKRTKGWFSGTLNFKVSPFAEKYRVLYEFVSGTLEKGLPQEITDLLPIDFNKYEMGDEVHAILPTSVEIVVDDGTWIFKGYEESDKQIVSDVALENGNGYIKFTGVWEFSVNGTEPDETFTVTYTDGVDGEVIFDDQVYSDIKSGEATPEFNGTIKREGYEFAGWNPSISETVTQTVVYVAQWKKETPNNGSNNHYIPPYKPNDKDEITYDENDINKDGVVSCEEALGVGWIWDIEKNTCILKDIDFGYTPNTSTR